MAIDTEHRTLTTTEARSAIATGEVRYVLAASLALAVAAGAIIYWIYF